MTEIARQLARRGYTLRSGAAEGADLAFEIGSHLGDGDHEVYLPWAGYNDHDSDLCEPSPKAIRIAQTLHPTQTRLSTGALKLHARSVHQILGVQLDEPVGCVVCWTPGGDPTGETATATRLVGLNGIAVYNLGHPAMADTCADRIVTYVTAIASAAERSAGQPTPATELCVEPAAG